MIRFESSEMTIRGIRYGAPTFSPGLFDEAVATCCRADFSPKVRHEPDLMTTVFVLVESGLLYEEENAGRSLNLRLPIFALALRYWQVTALPGPRKLVSPVPGCRANISGEASPEP
jgi:hypothetical protein